MNVNKRIQIYLYIKLVYIEYKSLLNVNKSIQLYLYIKINLYMQTQNKNRKKETKRMKERNRKNKGKEIVRVVANK